MQCSLKRMKQDDESARCLPLQGKYPAVPKQLERNAKMAKTTQKIGRRRRACGQVL